MRLSILDYIPIFEDRSVQEAMEHSVSLAQHADKLGFHRYWLAEHHKVDSVASSAPEIMMMPLLENTTRIRIGAGGIMLPHYSAYKVAEMFKMMEARYPNRVDIALGHSPSYANVQEALNEGKTDPPNFDQQLTDLQNYFNDDMTKQQRFNHLKATPQIPTQPSMFILGSSKRSAERAGKLGVSFVFAPFGRITNSSKEIVDYYRTVFQSNHPNKKSYVIVSSFVLTHENNANLKQLEDSLHYWLQRIHYLDQPKYYYSPETLSSKNWTDNELEKRKKNEHRIISGNPESVATQIQEFQEFFNADEILLFPHIYGEDNRHHCLEQLSQHLIEK